MLDADVDRIRADRLRAFVERRKREAEKARIEAVERDERDATFEETGSVEAYEDVLQYLDANAGDEGSRRLARRGCANRSTTPSGPSGHRRWPCRRPNVNTPLPRQLGYAG